MCINLSLITRLMRNRHLTPPQRIRAAGFTLIELMVALVLGLVVIGGVMGVFMSTYQANAQNIKAVRLNEEMRAVMSLMSRDIRRAGSKAIDWTTTAWYVTTNPMSTASAWVVSKQTGAPDNSCIRMAYALSATGPTDTNRFGYRLNPTTGRIETYNHNNQWSCNGTGWQPLTDPKIAWIQSLSFTASIEPGLTGVMARTVSVNLRAGTHTRSTTPSTLTAAQCSNVDVVCRQIQEKIRVRNDAVP
ncbi:PilW family protein [Immundisolibacter sp.]